MAQEATQTDVHGHKNGTAQYALELRAGLTSNVCVCVG